MPRHYVVVEGGGAAEVIDATAFAKKKKSYPSFFQHFLFLQEG